MRDTGTCSYNWVKRTALLCLKPPSRCRPCKVTLSLDNIVAAVCVHVRDAINNNHTIGEFRKNSACLVHMMMDKLLHL